MSDITTEYASADLKNIDNAISLLEFERDGEIRKIETELRRQYRYSWEDRGQRYLDEASEEFRKRYAPRIADLESKRVRITQAFEHTNSQPVSYWRKWLEPEVIVTVIIAIIGWVFFLLK